MACESFVQEFYCNGIAYKQVVSLANSTKKVIIVVYVLTP